MTTTRKSFARKEILFQETDDGKVPVGWMHKWSDGREPSRFYLKDLPAISVAWLAVHGGRQKYGDDYNNATTIDEAVSLVEAMHERGKAGDYSRVRTTGGTGIAEIWILLAVADITEQGLEDVKATWERMPDDAKDGVRKDERVKAKAMELRAKAQLDKAPEPTVDPLGAFKPAEATDDMDDTEDTED